MTINKITPLTRPLSCLDGQEVLKWVGTEMALAGGEPTHWPDEGDPTEFTPVLWYHESVPYLQVIHLDIHVSGGQVLRLVSQLEDGTGYHGIFLVDADPSESDIESRSQHDIYRTREISELPLGLARCSVVRREGLNAVIELRVAMGPDTIRLVAGEVHEQLDGALRVAVPEESILIQLNDAMPAQRTDRISRCSQ